jgi:CheY-like chemotaxis protein
MKTLVVDDNVTYAEALADDIGKGSESVLDGENFSTLDQAETKLKDRIGEMQSGEDAAPFRVLINWELKLDGRKRQEALGEKLYQRVTWKHPEVPFRLYSFRLQETEAPCTRLPFMAGELPEPDDEEQVEAKEQACLAYMDEEFEKVQHGFKKVGPTLVSIVRLINGAIRAGKIEDGEQASDLPDLFTSVDLDEHLLDVVTDFLHCAEQRARLVGKVSTDSDSPLRQRQVVVVDDEVVGDGALEGESLWTAVLEILFEKDGFRFSTCLPSELQQDLRQLEDKDLVLMDIDFSQDANYDGAIPEFGGRELLKETHERLPHLPVVMMSSYDEGGLYEECMNRGAYGYLTKDWGSHTKFRTGESEEKWFREWQQAIEVPLHYKPFFQDTLLLRTLGVVSNSGLEGLRTALKDIEDPTVETGKTLATFFEEFVDGYLYYRGEVPKLRLKKSLASRSIRNKETGLPTGSLLRIMRNSIIHSSNFMHEKRDAWLYLLLLRVFMMRLLDRTASLGAERWTKVITDKFSAALQSSAALDRKRAISGRTFFENRNGEISEVNAEFLKKRNDSIEALASCRTLNATEFQFHIDAVVRCLAAIFPRADLGRAGVDLHELGDPSVDVSQLVKVLTRRSKVTGRYRQGFESLDPVDWVLNSRLRRKLFQSSDEDYEDVLRWTLATRCWLWYFDHLLADLNSLLFESTVSDRKQRTFLQESLYEAPDEKLVELFLAQQQPRYLFYYCLRIALYKISAHTRQLPDALEQRVSEIQSERQDTNSRLQELEVIIAQKEEEEKKRRRKEEKRRQGEINRINERLEKLSAYTGKKRFRIESDKLEARLKDLKETESDSELKQEVVDLKKERHQLEQERKSMAEREDDLRVAIQNARDESSNPDTFPDQVDALERSIRRKTTSLRDFLNLSADFDIDAWLRKARAVSSYSEVRQCVSELDDSLK